MRINSQQSMLRLLVLRGKGKILIALRNEESVMLDHVQKSCQNLTVRCQVVRNGVDLGMVVVTLALSREWWRELQINYLAVLIIIRSCN